MSEAKASRGCTEVPPRTEVSPITSDVARAVVVVGAGGHGAEVFCYLADLVREGWLGSFAGFLDDFKSCKEGQPDILGRIEDFSLDRVTGPERPGYIVAVGQSRVRKQLVERIEQRFGSRLGAWALIHPSAYVGSMVEIGAGSLLAPGSFATTRIRLGRHVILNVRASVSHDTVVEDFATVNPGATLCGNVRVGEGAFIGAGAVVRESVSIGAWSIVGAGAVVVRDIPPYAVAMGVPARVTRMVEP